MLITVSIILLPRLYKSFFQSQHISIGCGSTDSAGFFLHAGILTMCSGGRYLNLGDIHMGGKARKWRWYTCSLFCKLKGNQKKFLLRSWQLVHNFYFFHSSNVQTFSSLNLNAVFNFELTFIGPWLSPAAHNTAICLHREAQYHQSSRYYVLLCQNW